MATRAYDRSGPFSARVRRAPTARVLYLGLFRHLQSVVDIIQRRHCLTWTRIGTAGTGQFGSRPIGTSSTRGGQSPTSAFLIGQACASSLGVFSACAIR
jgi:hypothetical protein